MIIDYGDKDTELLHKNRKPIKRLPIDIQNGARRKLLIIDSAQTENDLRIPPGNRYERLEGKRKGFSSIRINDQWRITFEWKDGNAYCVKIEDYH
jgi:proteic killer suppression protein